MSGNAPRFVAGGVLLLVLSFVLSQAGDLTWAAVAAFIVGLLLVGRGFLSLIAGRSKLTPIVLVDHLSEVPLLFPSSVTRCTIEGEEASHPSPAALDLLPLASPDADTPSLIVTTAPEQGQVSLLTVLRVAESRFQVLAQRWTEEAVVRYTGEVERQELARVLEQLPNDLAGGDDDPGRRGAR